MNAIYLSGPMTGIPDYNFPAFRAAAARLRGQGLEVISPHEMDEAEGREQGDVIVQPWEHYLRRDLLVMLEKCSAVAVLPGWEKSRGAQLEVYVAKALGMPIWDAMTGASAEYLCDRCDAPMREHNNALYRTCGCKKGGYVTPQGRNPNQILMPYPASILEKAEVGV